MRRASNKYSPAERKTVTKNILALGQLSSEQKAALEMDQWLVPKQSAPGICFKNRNYAGCKAFLKTPATTAEILQGYDDLSDEDFEDAFENLWDTKWSQAQQEVFNQFDVAKRGPN